MPTLRERCSNIWKDLQHGAPKQTSQFAIPWSHVDAAQEQPAEFVPGKHYFQVRINEMYLTYARNWFKGYEPMVFVISEFAYGGYPAKEQAVPFVVGPSATRKNYGAEVVPDGMIFLDTRVAGLHPYRGGRLILSVSLCRVATTNYASRLLELVDNTAGALDFASAVSTYTKIAGVVLDGVEAVMGLPDSGAILGLRSEFDPDAGDPIRPRFMVLIDAPNINPEQLWVRNGRLVTGPSVGAPPFRSAPFVLYSITQVPERGDVALLPFANLVEAANREAAIAKDDSWTRAKANMSSLFQAMAVSADINLDQAMRLSEQYMEDMKLIHEHAVKIQNLGPNAANVPEADQQRAAQRDALTAKAASVLDA